MAALRDVEYRHTLDRTHPHGVEQQFPIKRKRIGGTGKTGAEHQHKAGGNTADNRARAYKQAHKTHCFLRVGCRGCGASTR